MRTTRFLAAGATLALAAMLAPGADAQPKSFPVQRQTAPLAAAGTTRYHGYSVPTVNDHRVDSRAAAVLFIPVDVSQMGPPMTSFEISCDSSFMPQFDPLRKAVAGWYRRALDHGAFKGTVAVNLYPPAGKPREFVRSCECRLQMVDSAGQRHPASEVPLDRSFPLHGGFDAQIW